LLGAAPAVSLTAACIRSRRAVLAGATPSEQLDDGLATRTAQINGPPPPRGLGASCFSRLMTPGRHTTPSAVVAAYKYPAACGSREELPKGPTGKILRREIKPPAREGASTAH
jgi:acyl-CoA synthetase (AMP-forming)/AMP-acid ligase II